MVNEMNEKEGPITSGPQDFMTADIWSWTVNKAIYIYVNNNGNTDVHQLISVGIFPEQSEGKKD